jgi:hypothetical protein
MDPSAYKTRICAYFASGLPCPYEPQPGCAFAHGMEELRRVREKVRRGHPKFKTVPCVYFLAGMCGPADRCAFLHPGAERVRPPALAPPDTPIRGAAVPTPLSSTPAGRLVATMLSYFMSPLSGTPSLELSSDSDESSPAGGGSAVLPPLHPE